MDVQQITNPSMNWLRSLLDNKNELGASSPSSKNGVKAQSVTKVVRHLNSKAGVSFVKHENKFYLDKESIQAMQVFNIDLKSPPDHAIPYNKTYNSSRTLNTSFFELNFPEFCVLQQQAPVLIYVPVQKIAKTKLNKTNLKSKIIKNKTSKKVISRSLLPNVKNLLKQVVMYKPYAPLAQITHITLPDSPVAHKLRYFVKEHLIGDVLHLPGKYMVHESSIPDPIKFQKMQQIKYHPDKSTCSPDEYLIFQKSFDWFTWVDSVNKFWSVFLEHYQAFAIFCITLDQFIGYLINDLVNADCS